MIPLAKYLILACVFLSFPNPVILSADQTGKQGNEKVKFRWAFVAIRNAPQKIQFEAITRDTALKTGDQFKFFIKLEKRCYLYLIYYSSTKDLRLLFPKSFDWLSDVTVSSEGWYIPENNNWFELTRQKGEEKFILLASAERLQNLESLIKESIAADQGYKEKLNSRALAEIRNLRKKHKRFKTHAEKPVSMIGYTRDVSDSEIAKSYNIADFAYEISAEKFYGKTFTINHQ
jgi:hypothetical protein